MFTTECSKPWAKKIKIGIQAQAILPMVEVVVIASDDGEADHPVAQDRLDEDGDHAGKAERLVADGLGLGDRDDAWRRRRPAAVVPKLVSAIASKPP